MSEWVFPLFKFERAKMFHLGIDVAKAKLDCSLLRDETGFKHKSKKSLMIDLVSLSYWSGLKNRALNLPIFTPQWKPQEFIMSKLRKLYRMRAPLFPL
jgi:hypothetical protein